MRTFDLRRWRRAVVVPVMLALVGGCTAMLPEAPPTAAPAPAVDARTRTDGFVPFVGGRYAGELRNGRPHGRGTFVADDGAKYVGGFADGRFEGSGRQEYPDGRVVEGRWSNDRAVDATLIYPDGSRFAGEIARGLPSGPGTLTLADGTRQTGRFRDGALQGTGLQVSRDGRAYAGPFVDGRPHGEGVCSGAGGASVCNRKSGVDDTARALRDGAAARARKQVEDEAAARAGEIDRQLKPAVDRTQAQVRELSKRESSLQGPQSGDDCYCSITNMCITVGNSNATRAERARDAMLARQRDLECRSRYAEYLGYRNRADFQQELQRLQSQVAEARAEYAAAEGERQRRLREVEDAKRRQLADAAAMRARADAEQRKLEAERQRRLDEQKRRCSDPAQQRATPCACAGVLGTWRDLRGSVCEA